MMSQFCTNTSQILPSVGEDTLNLILLVQTGSCLTKIPEKWPRRKLSLPFSSWIEFPSFHPALQLFFWAKETRWIFLPLCSVPGTAWNACSDFTAMAWKRNSGKKYSRISNKKQRGTMKLVIITSLSLFTLGNFSWRLAQFLGTDLLTKNSFYSYSFYLQFS